jgi:hypothetical protein
MTPFLNGWITRIWGGVRPDHRLGLVAHGQDRVVILVDRDDRRLVDDDPLALHEHERVRRSQVDRDVS